MSKEALATVIQRALSDPTFRRRLVTDPTALGAFDLTDNEAAALRSGDPSRLTAFGIDQRMSKIFMIDPGAGAASVVAGVGSEPRDVEPYWVGGSSEAVTGTGNEPRDIAPYWVGGSSEAVTAGNGTDEGQLIPGTWTDVTTDALTSGGTEPRDIEPVDIGTTDITPTDSGSHGEY